MDLYKGEPGETFQKAQKGKTWFQCAGRGAELPLPLLCGQAFKPFAVENATQSLARPATC